MIYIFLGGIGSGKSLSMIRSIVDRKDNFALTNFRLKKIKNYHRIKFSDIIIPALEKGDKPRVNWEFWDAIRKKHKNFSIYIDEIHNVIHARRSMSKENILMSKWVSQIRKILQDKPNNNLYIISQTMSKIDKDFRDLAHLIIKCRAIKLEKEVIIIQDVYTSYEHYEYGVKSFTSYFRGKKYFDYYDSLDMVTFGDSEEFI